MLTAGKQHFSAVFYQREEKCCRLFVSPTDAHKCAVWRFVLLLGCFHDCNSRGPRSRCGVSILRDSNPRSVTVKLVFKFY